MTRFDLFANALFKFDKTGHATLYVEREDGYREREDISWYFTTYRSFPKHERQALAFARGRVLDVGCGAGRHSLYLQNRGLRVTAIDVSPRTIELALKRGVRDARVADLCAQLPFRDGEFDTVILFGNNMGLCGTPAKFQRLLEELGRVTSGRGRILGTTRQPSTSDPRHLGYLRRNIVRGRAIGQLRLRLLFDGVCGPWFDLLLLSPTDLMSLAEKMRWVVKVVFPLESFELGYSVVMEKADATH